MARVLFIIIGCLYILPGLNAQQKPCATIHKTYPNLSNKSIFAAYPGTDRLVVEFEQTTPVSLSLYHKPDSLKTAEAGSRAYYDLDFEGDKYLFKKHHQTGIPVLPREEVDYMAGRQQCKINYSLSATVYKDSVVYRFSQCCPSNKTDDVYFKRFKPGAAYKGDISQLASALQAKYDAKAHRPAGDSVLIFRGFVNQRELNHLEHIVLLEGTASPFSDFIRQGLEQSGKLWAPMLQGGRAVKSYIRIYARLHSDESITLSAAN